VRIAETLVSWLQDRGAMGAAISKKSPRIITDGGIPNIWKSCA
jgi:hypothetical protein